MFFYQRFFIYIYILFPGALLVPGRVTLKQGASAVWAGYHATFVLDAAQEKVFAFGLNNYGQLGESGAWETRWSRRNLAH